ncbi:hypothetical protein D3C72_2183370 [compost metagenome]
MAHGLGIGAQCQRRLGGQQALLRAREQRQPQGLLQCGDVAAHRGLRHAQGAGCAGERSLLQHAQVRAVQLPADGVGVFGVLGIVVCR